MGAMSVQSYSASHKLIDITDLGSPGPKFGGNAGFWSCVFNLANASMGAGVLAFPYAMEKAGWALGGAMAIGGAMLFCFTLNVVGQASDRAFELASVGMAVVTEGSYQEVTGAVLGKAAGKAMTWMLTIYLTCSNVAFLVIMSDQAQPVLIDRLGPDSVWTKKTVLVPIFAWGIGFPLSMIRNIELFSIPSTVSQFGIFYSVAIVAYYGFKNVAANEDNPGYGSLVPYKFELDAVTAIPLICFSYQCHVTFPLVYASMRGKSLGRMKIVNLVCIVGCMTIYLVIGAGGYVMLGGATPDDILKGICGSTGYFNKSAASGDGCCMVRNGSNGTGGNDYLRDDPSHDPCSSRVEDSVAIARLCVLIKVACSFGMITFVARSCIQSIVMPEGKKFSKKQKFGVNVVYVGFCMVVAMFCPGLADALSFAGVLVVVIDLIFPGLMMYKLNYRSSSRGAATRRFVAVVIVILGIVIGGISLFVTVQQIVDQIGGPPSGAGNHSANPNITALLLPPSASSASGSASASASASPTLVSSFA